MAQPVSGSEIVGSREDRKREHKKLNKTGVLGWQTCYVLMSFQACHRKSPFNKRELAPGGVLGGQKSNPKKFPVILTKANKIPGPNIKRQEPCWIHLGHCMEYFITGFVQYVVWFYGGVVGGGGVTWKFL